MGVLVKMIISNSSKMMFGILFFTVLSIFHATLYNEDKNAIIAKNENNSIAMSCLLGTDNKMFNTNEEKGYSNENCDVYNNKIVYNVLLEEEASTRYFTIALNNNGNTNMAINVNNIKKSGNVGLYNVSDNTLYTSLDSNGINNFFSIDQVVFKVNNTIINIKEAASDKYMYNGYYFIEPGNTLYLLVKVSWNDGYNITDKNYFSANINYTFSFEKVTNDMLEPSTYVYSN